MMLRRQIDWKANWINELMIAISLCLLILWLLCCLVDGPFAASTQTASTFRVVPKNLDNYIHIFIYLDFIEKNPWHEFQCPTSYGTWSSPSVHNGKLPSSTSQNLLWSIHQPQVLIATTISNLKGAKLIVPKAARGWKTSARLSGFVLIKGLPSLR